MSTATDTVSAAQAHAMNIRPKVGGFPVLAEVLRRAGQAGQTTFPEFLGGAWQAGVVSYAVDLEARTVTYRGCDDRSYLEPYPAVSLD